MLRYRVFGGVFAAPFAFPELRAEPLEVACDWTLRTVDGPPPPEQSHLVGEDELAPGICAHLSRTSRGLRLEFDDTGTFDIVDRGASIVWYPAAGCDTELVRVDILGRVLAAATHESGTLCLHGSAVAVSGRAIGFLAGKGFGKSTLAMAMASRGARLLTDDTLPLDPVTGKARPGVHSVRLWTDAAASFNGLGEGRMGLSDKRTFDSLPDQLVQHSAVPVAALYLLAPRAATEILEVVRRIPMAPTRATIALMQHSKLGALLGGAESRHVFDRCARVAETIPVFELEIARAFDSLGEVAETIGRWHS